MESYVFKTDGGRIGYFQKDAESCKIYFETGNYRIEESRCWKDWECYQKAGRDNAPKSSHDDPMSKAVSFFLWSHIEIVSTDIVEFRKNPYKGGTYFPRINRDYSNLYRYQMLGGSFVDEVRAYYNIVESMESVFKVVEPTLDNLKAFGHRIRKVLIIACTEVEYLLRQALEANGYKPKGLYGTLDYVKLLPIYKLNEYDVELKMHPMLERMHPFKEWKAKNSTGSLFWYDAYNSTKHDRGGNFNKASIEAMVNAVAAIHILLEAQYGSKIFDKPMDLRTKVVFAPPVDLTGTYTIFLRRR